MIEQIESICQGIILIQGSMQKVYAQQHTYYSQNKILNTPAGPFGIHPTKAEALSRLCPQHKKVFDEWRKEGYYGNSKLCTLYRTKLKNTKTKVKKDEKN